MTPYDNDPTGIWHYIERRIGKMEDLKEITRRHGIDECRLQRYEYNLVQDAPPSGASVQRAFSKLNSMLDNRNFAEHTVENYFLYANAID